MRISKEKKRKKLYELIEEFKKNEFLSFEDIKKILDCGKTAAHDYLKEVKDIAKLETKKINGFTYYHLVLKDDLDKYEKMEKSDLTMFDTLQIIQRFSKKQLNQEQLYLCPDDMEYSRLVSYSKSTFDNNVDTLVKKGIVDKQKVGGMVLVKERKNYRVCFSYNDLKQCARKLNEVVPTDRYYSQLSSIKNKINPYVGDIDDDIFNKNYFCYGKSNNMFSKSLSDFKKYDHIDFIGHTVKITYCDRNNDQFECFLNTGFITYVEEKDTVYIVGKELENNEFYPIIIADSVISIEETDLYNNCYLDAEFTEMYVQMFSISTEKPYDVEVVFDNIFNIMNKVKRLAEKRKHTSTVVCMNNKIYYRDKIRGLRDFAVYLRRYGKSCRVVKPVELIDIMNASVDRALKKYEEMEVEKDE